tara:strand:- start:3728 stop:4669 length:942 start_codon:yes stop_codon:yes gene_type:complete
MKILITGGAGFIGSHLTKLLSVDNDVIIYDIKPSKQKNVKSIVGDVNNFQKNFEYSEDIDIVIHLAASVGVENTETDPIMTMNSNILGTKNVLEFCKNNNVKKIILASSSEVYGEPIKIPIEESQTPIPITTYGISKLASEEYVKSYAKMHGLKYSILRFFNVVGPNQSRRFVLPEFINNALANKPLLIHGEGSQIRAFCHISDICQGIKKAISDGDGEIINIGNDLEPITIENLAKKVISKLDSTSQIEYIPFENSGRKRDKEILTRFPSIQKAKKLLQYQPKINLEKIISDIAQNSEPIDFVNSSQSIEDT